VNRLDDSIIEMVPRANNRTRVIINCTHVNNRTVRQTRHKPDKGDAARFHPEGPRLAQEQRQEGTRMIPIMEPRRGRGMSTAHKMTARGNLITARSNMCAGGVRGFMARPRPPVGVAEP
jgi:hypothetical protein